ncbi:MAG: hypothetical protein JWL90_3429 [Chthoniobacteraceae bacterium]|nr:hypothetical protein [Chthoniobacteraceae bacterium]
MRQILRPCTAARRESRKAVALVIVLAFIVLLTSVVIAFFSLALGQRQISDRSANQTKVEIFSHGALDIILGDLKQEVIAGSSAPSPGLEIYPPAASASVKPDRVGTNDLLPNLLKQSAYGEAFYSGSSYDLKNHPPSNRASNVKSDIPSVNGRLVSRERWNKPLMLPKKSEFLNDDSNVTPIDDFRAPDWIPISRDGSDSKGSMSDVLGRYAYCIYDEGGVLNANVAGHPLNRASHATRPNGMTVAQTIEISRKGSVAFADLAEIGLTRAQVDQLIGWRNYASTRPGGSLPAFQFDVDSTRTPMDRYNRMALSNITGFMTIAAGGLYHNQSDRIFTSRQELIRFLLQGIASTSLQRAKMQSALQYVSVFSRDLNQPSFSPDLLRPKISGTKPATADMQTYIGNNDSQGLDDHINPAFLTVRADRTFRRLDGTAAILGEPLVKKRFPLSRLALITPNATGPADDASPIYRQFGLSRSRPDQPWLYNHQISGRIIARLEDLKGGSREPDCVELLKAAICAGSLGKSAATDGAAGAYAHEHDISLDYQILQIFANIIDQFDADGFPTRIALSDGTEFRGIENVPYFYRYRVGTVQSKLPKPMGTGTWKPVANSPVLTESGSGIFLLLPEIWNPHDQNSTMGSPRPTDFRLIVDATEALKKVESGGQIATEVVFTGAPANAAQLEPAHSVDSASTELLFQVASAELYREPTFLGRAGLPTGSNLRAGLNHALRSIPESGTHGEIMDVMNTLADASSPGFLGVYLGSFPLRRVWDTSGAANQSKIYSAGTVIAKLSIPALCVRMQYKDSFGHWLTYDQKAINAVILRSDLNGGHPGVRPYNNGVLPGLNNSWGQCSDPRTSRFGFASDIDAPRQLLDAGSDALKTSRPDRGAGAAATASGAPAMGITPSRANGSIGWAPENVSFGLTSRFRSGLLSQNSSDVLDDQRIDGKPITSAAALPVFYCDPDGIPRRGMSAYVPSGRGWSAVTETGLPLVPATTYPASTPTSHSQSRPILLNRPFQSVAELGYVFRDLPWKELDFFTPESGDAALLDVFCINEDATPDGMNAGKVDLNTRQAPVIRAILAGAYKDEIAALPASGWARSTLPALTSNEIESIANALVDRTRDRASNRGPMRNVAELVGKHVYHYQSSYGQPFDGFSGDLNIYDGGVTGPANIIKRFRETAIRALSDAGTTRVWNLMIDLIVQSGRYPTATKNLADFLVEGERRVWFHVAIDRWTGEILDRQLEVVSE